MKVIHVNFSDKRGGAGIAAYRLHRNMTKNSIESYLFVREKITHDFNVITPGKILTIRNKTNSKLEIMAQKLFGVENYSFPIGIIPDSNYIILRKHCPEIINLHWINGGFFSINNLSKIRTKYVWTLHDMWLFNSFSHYSNNYLNADQKKIDKLVINYKKNAINKIKDIIFITPSRWLYECASKSLVLQNKDIRVIRNGIDTELFKPANRCQVRAKYNIDQMKKVILFGAFNAENSKRKGIDLLKNALLKFFYTCNTNNNIEVVVFGGQEIKYNNDFGFPTKYIGRITDENELASIYTIADIFVLPSRMDNLPNTAIEALSCGVPVLAFNIGGLNEIVDHKINGYLALPFSADDLIEGLKFLLFNMEIDLVRVKSREKALKNFDIKTMTLAYNEVYEELLYNNK